MKRILPVVEGDGDFAAVPELIRKVAKEMGMYDLQVLRPHKRGDLPKVRKRFEDFLRVAALEGAPILWVMDYDCSECDNALRDQRDLAQRASLLSLSQPVQFVFLVQEFETLFLADNETTRSVFTDISDDTSFPENPERVRDAKGWLSKARPKGAAYKPTQHQARITSQLDLPRLRLRSPSFVSFENAIHALL